MFHFNVGFSVYKTCGSLGLAGEAAVDIISSYRRSLTANASSTDDFTVGIAFNHISNYVPI
jgi:hypothetical protein